MASEPATLPAPASAETEGDSAPRAAPDEAKPAPDEAKPAPNEAEPAPGDAAAPQGEAPGGHRRVVRLRSGRSVEVEDEGDGAESLAVRAPDGRIELSVRLTDRGPVLSLRAARLVLEGEHAVDVECEDFRVRARNAVDLSAGGDARVEGHGVMLESRRADVSLQANDDVRLDGERVLLNC